MIDSIIKGFDVWTDAQGVKSKGRVKSIDNISLEGIARLRELILDFAIRGKLVQQDENDEPATVLLKKINQERIIKKTKQEQLLLTPDDKNLFQIPKNWEIGLLGNIFEITSSKRIHVSDYVSDGIPFFRSKEIGELQKGEPISTDIFISTEKYNELKYLPGFPNKGDIMLTSVGTIGNTWICDGRSFYYKDGNITKISAIENFNMRFVQYYIASPLFLKQVIDSVSGTAYNALTIIKLKKLIFPLPPLAEQHRIVTKVDELMKLCDKLEEEQTNNLKTHHHLVKCLLETLTQANDADEFQSSWEKISQHFDTLFCTEDSIEQLKQTILQLAVMGKLVKQDSKDESAVELLKEISKEKELLVKEGKIRKQTVLPEITEGEKPFILPSNWALSRLGTFTIVGTGATPSRDRLDYYFPTEINWVTSGETRDDFIFTTNEKISHLALKETNVSIYPKGSLIIAMYGQGKTRGQVSELMIDAATNQACAAVVFVNKEESHRKYLKLFFKMAYEQIRSNASGGAQPNLNLGKVANTVIPLPPIAEQKRIVKKVDKLFSVCDLLKEKITKSEEIKNTLSKTIIEIVQ